jgi:hypothetical protein
MWHRTTLDAGIRVAAIEVHVFLPVFVAFVIMANAATFKLFLDGVNEVPQVSVVTIANDRHVHKLLRTQATGEVAGIWIEVENE